MSTDCKLDRIDLRILSQLQKRGRITNVELADAVGLSPSPCLIRVKRLEKAGYIIGYGAQIQLEKLGDVQIVFTEVTLADHRREDFIKFVNAIGMSTRSSSAIWRAAATTTCSSSSRAASVTIRASSKGCWSATSASKSISAT